MKKRINKNFILSLIILIFLLLIIYLILNNNIKGIDTYIYHSIMQLYPRFNGFFKVCTFLGSTLFIVLLSLLCLIVLRKRKNYFIAIGIIGSTILNNVIKLIIQRDRPSILRLVEEDGYSFPSGHTMASTTLMGMFVYLIWLSKMKKKYKIILTCVCAIIVLFVSMSRIYLGVHFASDVVGAIIISLIFLNVYILFIQKKGFIK